MRRKLSYIVSDYRNIQPRKSNDMYEPSQGYQLATNVPAALGRISQTILSRAVDEGWQMPSEIPLHFEGKRYIAKYQWHGPNSGNPKKHPGIGLYERVEGNNISKPSSMGAKLNDGFYAKLAAMCNRLGIDPKDMLAIMYMESALDPSIIGTNPKTGKQWPARGLTQIEPFNAKMVGWKGDANSFMNEFGKLSAEEQLPYIEKYFENLQRNTGGAHTLTQLYIANFWPKALSYSGVKREDPSAIVVDSNANSVEERKAYDANKGLDADKDGKITYGDLTRLMNGKRNALDKGGIYAKLDAASNQQSKPNYSIDTSSISGFISSIERILDNFMSTADNKSTSYLISLGSDNDFVSKLEFATVLKTAIEEELGVSADIYTSDGNVEMLCGIESDKALDALKELCYAMSDTFEYATRGIGGVKIFSIVSQDQKTSCQELGIKLAEMNHRKFMLKFCGDR